MGHEVTIGGSRLGAGKKMKAHITGFERSTHDLSFAWRSSMANGTLVPCLNLIGLPGDTFYIDVEAFSRTLPTIRPLFGSYKVQIDVFTCPFRLYNAALHNNKLGIGMDMSKIYLPQMDVQAYGIGDDFVNHLDINNRQINQSSLLAYLGIRAVGHAASTSSNVVRRFNATPLLAYWDIYKNYYANKQEPNGYYMQTIGDTYGFGDVMYKFSDETESTPMHVSQMINSSLTPPIVVSAGINITKLILAVEKNAGGTNGSNIRLRDSLDELYTITDIFDDVTKTAETLFFEYWECINPNTALGGITFTEVGFKNNAKLEATAPTAFQLTKIDDLRNNILSANQSSAFLLEPSMDANFNFIRNNLNRNYAICSMQGLGVKTYQSDLFNNYVQTEWLTGVNGVSTVTAISTASGSFTMDTLNLSQKLYNMLTKIALSGGSYNDWIEAVYDNGGFWTNETPVYVGGLSKEIVFEEVVSTAATDNNPQGNLAGKGIMSQKNKGGHIKIKVHEPMIILGIVSITPRLDYSQGNDWSSNLISINDLHKPNLDQIGFQDLPTDWINAIDTLVTSPTVKTLYSAGKQPAWIHYMTNFNKTFGTFADANKEMSMTLNRNYSINVNTGRITDLTTYINPSKFNYPFAQTSLDAQNFWMQIGWGITARRLISAKVIPNL